jgi:hypothetical protein
MKSKNEALTYMASLTMVSELSIAILTTSVTLRVSHSSMPKIASQKNQKNICYPNLLWIKFCSNKYFKKSIRKFVIEKRR